MWFLPPGLFIILLFLLWMYMRLKHLSGRKFVFFILLLLYILSIAPVSDVLVRGLERHFVPGAHPAGDVLVFLGGGAVTDVPDLGAVDQLSSVSASRLMTAARLQRLTGLALILSGGRIFTAGAEEAVVAKRVLMELGIPESKILVEAHSRNTAENAKYTRVLCGEKKWQQVILITSAMHMPRSVAFFERQGLKVVPYPCDYQVDGTIKLTALSFVPNAGSLSASSAALKEYLGMAAFLAGLQ